MNHGADEARARIQTVTLNGVRVPLAEAKISVMAPGLTYAATVFEGIRAYWSAEADQLWLFRLDEHIERFVNSMRLLRFDDPPSFEAVRRQVIDDVAANGYREDTYVRLQAYIDDWGDMTATGPVGMAIVSRPRPRVPAFETGRDFGVSSWRRLADNASPPRVKATANYLNGRLAGLDAKAAGYDGAILLTERGTVSEGPGGCIFIVRDGMLITPSVTSGILESVTRDTLILLARANGLACIEREIDRTELYIADEGFYCGTGQEVVPMLSVDRLPVGDGRPGPITRRLQALYDDEVRGRSDGHADWRTAVYEAA